MLQLFALFAIFLQAGADKNDSRLLIGGYDAKHGEFPYIVSVEMKAEHICGGTIITQEWVLSAAHCFFSYPNPLLYTVLTGTINLNSGGRRYWVQDISMHPFYNHGRRHNDTALLQLRKKILFNSSTYKVNLPIQDTPSGTYVVLSSWGSTIENANTFSENLKALPLVTITNKECLKGYESINYTPQLLDDNFCTIAQKGKGFCYRDNGSPLIDPYHNRLVGITSSAIGCATGIPEVYVRIYRFLSWINDTINFC